MYKAESTVHVYASHRIIRNLRNTEVHYYCVVYVVTIQESKQSYCHVILFHLGAIITEHNTLPGVRTNAVHLRCFLHHENKGIFCISRVWYCPCF